MDHGRNSQVSERSDAEAFDRVSREMMARVLGFVGAETPGAVSATVEAVRALSDSGYTVGDSQVDQQIIAGGDADVRIQDRLALIDDWDRAVILRHVTRTLHTAAGGIEHAEADFLEMIGNLLEMRPEDVEYVVVSELAG